MEVALKAVSLGRAARQDQNLKTRQPPRPRWFQVPSAAARRAIERFHQEVCEELNVETVSFAAEGEELVHSHAASESTEAGQEARQARQADSRRDGAAFRRRGQTDRDEGAGRRAGDDADDRRPIELLSDEILLSAQSAEGLAARTEDGLVVGITTEITLSCAIAALPVKWCAPSVSCAKSGLQGVGSRLHRLHHDRRDNRQRNGQPVAAGRKRDAVVDPAQCSLRRLTCSLSSS